MKAVKKEFRAGRLEMYNSLMAKTKNNKLKVAKYFDFVFWPVSGFMHTQIRQPILETLDEKRKTKS